MRSCEDRPEGYHRGVMHCDLHQRVEWWEGARLEAWLSYQVVADDGFPAVLAHLRGA